MLGNNERFHPNMIWANKQMLYKKLIAMQQGVCKSWLLMRWPGGGLTSHHCLLSHPRPAPPAILQHTALQLNRITYQVLMRGAREHRRLPIVCKDYYPVRWSAQIILTGSGCPLPDVTSNTVSTHLQVGEDNGYQGEPPAHLYHTDHQTQFKTRSRSPRMFNPARIY